MKTRRNVSLALVIMGQLWFLSQHALAAQDIVVDISPPAPRAEHEPPHRDGYVWAPGYWEWAGGAFHWTSGTWIAERRGHWVADHWDPMGNQWRYVKGHWER
jgi:hypothetical protein